MCTGGNIGRERAHVMKKIILITILCCWVSSAVQAQEASGLLSIDGTVWSFLTARDCGRMCQRGPAYIGFDDGLLYAGGSECCEEPWHCVWSKDPEWNTGTYVELPGVAFFWLAERWYDWQNPNQPGPFYQGWMGAVYPSLGLGSISCIGLCLLANPPIQTISIVPDLSLPDDICESNELPWPTRQR
jgi:hypothetical protein